MSNYLYKTYLYTNTQDVLTPPATNTADLADFESNHKDDAMQISELVLAETSFSSDKTYADFKALVTTPISWSDIKFVIRDKFYELILISDTPL